VSTKSEHRDPIAGTSQSSGVFLEKTRRIPELDGLRGIAIALVLWFHYFVSFVQTKPGSVAGYLQTCGRLSWTGVDLFFVLSGFLIGGILLDARGCSNYFRVFYTRRFFRIVPLYAICVCATFLLIPLARGIHAGRQGAIWLANPIPWYSYPFFLQNVWIATTTTFGQAGISVTWSLAIEEQFYLTLPLVIYCSRGYRRLALIVGGIVAAPILRTVLWTLWPKIMAPFVLMPCRADALLLGVLGATLVRDEGWLEWLAANRRVLQIALGVLLAGAAVLNFVLPRAQWLLVGVGLSWIAGLYLTTLLYAISQPKSWLSRLLRNRWLRGLGTIAYGAYLSHMYVLNAVFHLVWPHSWDQRVAVNSVAAYSAIGVSLILTVTASGLSWLFLEKPLLQLGHRAKYLFASRRTS
jgi:peptidoglycan/LPS O-acetylase OafA/YrhL